VPIASPALADGPAMFLGSSILSFALPYGAFIIVAAALFMLFRARHSGPRLKYLPAGTVTSVMTLEPAPAPEEEPPATPEEPPVTPEEAPATPPEGAE
jgi:hypothetical protein